MTINFNEHAPIRGERMHQGEVHRDGSTNWPGEHWGGDRKEKLADINAAEVDEVLGKVASTAHPNDYETPVYISQPAYARANRSSTEPSTARVQQTEPSIGTRTFYGDPARVVTGEPNRPIVVK